MCFLFFQRLLSFTGRASKREGVRLPVLNPVPETSLSSHRLIERNDKSTESLGRKQEDRIKGNDSDHQGGASILLWFNGVACISFLGDSFETQNRGIVSFVICYLTPEPVRCGKRHMWIKAATPVFSQGSPRLSHTHSSLDFYWNPILAGILNSHFADEWTEALRELSEAMELILGTQSEFGRRSPRFPSGSFYSKALCKWRRWF